MLKVMIIESSSEIVWLKKAGRIIFTNYITEDEAWVVGLDNTSFYYRMLYCQRTIELDVEKMGKSIL